MLERFLKDSSRLVTALAEKEGELSPLVNHLNRTTRALGSEKEALAEVVARLPDFMRTANSTYVNLRAALDDVDPLVEASKPVARKLGPYLDELRPFANEAIPTIRDLARLTGSPGPGNDLLELNRTYPPLANIAVDTEQRADRLRHGPRGPRAQRGSFPEAAEAFRDSAPIVAQGRPYTPDFVSWFDDSSDRAYDALGSFSRSQTLQPLHAQTAGIPSTSRARSSRSSPTPTSTSVVPARPRRPPRTARTCGPRRSGRSSAASSPTRWRLPNEARGGHPRRR